MEHWQALLQDRPRPGLRTRTRRCVYCASSAGRCMHARTSGWCASSRRASISASSCPCQSISMRVAVLAFCSFATACLQEEQQQRQQGQDTQAGAGHMHACLLAVCTAVNGPMCCAGAGQDSKPLTAGLPQGPAGVPGQHLPAQPRSPHWTAAGPQHLLTGHAGHRWVGPWRPNPRDCAWATLRHWSARPPRCQSSRCRWAHMRWPACRLDCCCCRRLWCPSLLGLFGHHPRQARLLAPSWRRDLAAAEMAGPACQSSCCCCCCWQCRRPHAAGWSPAVDLHPGWCCCHHLEEQGTRSQT